jgi:hypothetical protein
MTTSWQIYRDYILLSLCSLWWDNLLDGGYTVTPWYIYCSLPLWRVHEIKRMYLAPRTHGLFIT